MVAVGPNNEAFFQLSLAQERNVEDAANAFYGNESISVRSAWSDDDPDVPLQATRLFSASSGEVYGAAGFVEMGEGILRLLAVSKANVWSRYENTLERTLRSTSKLKGNKYRNLKPTKVQLVTLKRDMSLEEFNRKYPSSVDLKRLALLNPIGPDGVLKKGTRAKRVTGFDAGPQTGVVLPRKP